MNNKEYKLFLPAPKNKDLEPVEVRNINNSIIIIGANGAGKTRLGVWLEQKEPEKTHRISAQKSLSFGKEIQLRSLSQSLNLLINGTETLTTEHSSRWGGWDGEKYNYACSLLNDYEYVLSAFIAYQSNQESKYIKECKLKDSQDKSHNKVPNMIKDSLKKIWNEIFAQRDIDIEDNKIVTSFKSSELTNTYNGNEMSDGERVALYLILQALVIPENKTIIIDEPEIHLHRSIMNRLWNAIEEERPDCIFVYITHDTEFAAQHKQAKKIWVKSYDGDNWDWQEVKDSDLPEELLLNILGNRKPVIFVEGEKDSLDIKLLSEIYKDYYIKPCGSCFKVIENTKAMKNTSQLHDLKCYGIIDRDYRTDEEIKNLGKHNVFALQVAEIENLFLVPELLEVVNSIEGNDDNVKVEEVKRYIELDRFSKEINKQILLACIEEIKYQLSIYDLSSENDKELKNKFEELNNYIDFENIKQSVENKYKSALGNYKEILKIYNRKSLSESVGHYFNRNDKDYCDFVLRQLKTDNSQKIVEALLPYLPNNKQIPNPPYNE